MGERKKKIPLLVGDSNDPVLVEVRPGQRVIPVREEDVPEIAIGEWVPRGDGSYRFVARRLNASMRVNPKTFKLLHIGISINTMKRLIAGGFVRGGKVSPFSYCFDVASYYEHLQRVYDDAEFWDVEHPDQNRQRFNNTIGVESGPKPAKNQ